MSRKLTDDQLNLPEKPQTEKQGVALTGRNTTGPPCSVTVKL